MESVYILIMAAGRGTRMGQDHPKVLSRTNSDFLLSHVLKTALELDPEKIVVIAGYKHELVKEEVEKEFILKGLNMGKLRFVLQEKQLGTGDAIKAALPELEGCSGSVLILSGDVPLIRSETLSLMLKKHAADKATLTLLSSTKEDPGSGGRIWRNTDGQVQKIVEAKDCSDEELKIKEVNSGIYVVDSAFLAPAIKDLKNENAQGEYYLTDIVEHASREGQIISHVNLTDQDQVFGVNNRFELSQVNQILKMRRIKELIESGVEIEDQASVLVDEEAEIAPGVRIGPWVRIKGKCRIGKNTVFEGNSYVVDSDIGENCLIKFSSRIEQSTIEAGASIGPFAHLRPDSKIGKGARVGNFVEIKKATLKDGAKANHLAYLGDCTVGENSNIGAGTITCNYDGANKHHTEIGKDVFVGSNSSLIAPVEIGDGATIGAGSVISKSVSKNSLALTRAKLIEKSGWLRKKKQKGG